MRVKVSQSQETPAAGQAAPAEPQPQHFVTERVPQDLADSLAKKNLSFSGQPGPGILSTVGYVILPNHLGKGDFDHAAVHAKTGCVYVAHTANDAIDVFDPASARHLFSVPNLPSVAGVLVSNDSDLVISSNRAENTIAIFEPGPNPQVSKVRVGRGSNGLAYDSGRGLILAANIGDPEVPGSHTLSVVDADTRTMRAEIGVPGRTRWAVYEPSLDAYFINIADPPRIVVIDAGQPDRVAQELEIPAVGPHGLDIDGETQRLFCACDGAILVTVDARSGRILGQHALSGVPDVVFFNQQNKELYVAIGDPGVIDVFDTVGMDRLGSIATEKGAHIVALAPHGDRLFAFLPATHRAAFYRTSKG
jgi:DNA-binding beta-propeller fold protein YncE